MAKLKTTIINGTLTVDSSITVGDSNQNWLNGFTHPSIRINDARDNAGYHPWISQKNMSSGHMYSIGIYQDSLRLISSKTSRTQNGADHNININNDSGYISTDYSLSISNALLVTKNATFQENITVKAIIGMTNSTASNNAIYRKWKDGSNHDMIMAATDLLTQYVGWNGKGSDNKTYNSILTLRGKSITCNGSTSWSSDKNLKHSIEALNNKYENFFNALNPVTFQYDLGDSQRYHIGYIAQDVENALHNSDLSTQDFAGIVILPLTEREQEFDETGTEARDVKGSETNYLLDKGIKQRYNLAYTEFIALNTHMIQKQGKIIEELKDEINSLQEQINSLKQK